MKHTRWLERKFSFDFPVTHFPFFLERIRGTHPRLVAITYGLDDVKLSARQDPSWSLKEHIGHLSDLEELHDRRIDDYIQQKDVLRAADMSNAKTVQAHHNEKPVSELLNNFLKVRTDFIRRLESLDDEVIARPAMHPRLQQPMRLADMVFFVAEHDDHHLVLMRNLLQGR